MKQGTTVRQRITEEEKIQWRANEDSTRWKCESRGSGLQRISML